MKPRRSGGAARITGAFAAMAVLLLPPVAAQEVVVQNDSVSDLGQASIQAGFVANELAAAWLTSPCEGEIIRVQVAWASFTGGSPAVLGESITVFEAGTFPTPGSELASIVGPLMNDGFFNEFALPFPAPIQQDEVFVVAFKFFESPPPTNGPSVMTDVDGCQAGKNGIFAIPPSAWFSSCALGVNGDFAIRAVVMCQSPLIFADGFESGNTTAWSETLQ